MKAQDHQEKDRLFQERKKSGAWPAKRCPECQGRGYERVGSAACCVSYAHHVGDCCTHCGNDERGRSAFGRVRKSR